jgi:D-glucosaminate-6-phosphate ammonia-lyase
MAFYESLGLRRVINADARLTRLGGSLMPEVVLEAMRAAAGSYVDIVELQARVGARLAQLTRNEAAYVCAGAAAGLTLATLAAMNGGELQTIARQLAGEAPRDEVIIHTAQRIPYDAALVLAGARLVAVGNALQTFEWELEAAFTPRTAAVLYVAGAHLQRGALPLEATVRLAHARGVPVIVDAAAQLPPPENLWRFTAEQGADLAIFSGGKDLRGPQASGLVVGRARWVDAVAANGSPNQRLGRPMKVGKEEMAGLLAAVAHYLEQDHPARVARYEQLVADWGEALDGIPGVRPRREFPNEAGQPTPRLYIAIDPATVGFDGLAARQRLWEGDPRIAVAADAGGISIAPDTLDDGQEALLIARIRQLLGG